MSKRKNYTNYYSKSKYEKKEVEDKPQEEVEDKLQKEDIQEEVEEIKPEKFPEGNFEKTKLKKSYPPECGDLITNLYIHEKPEGDKIPKDELDRFMASKVLKDVEGNSILPKGARVYIFDMVETEDGSVWYNTRYGYLKAKNKSGKEYIKAVQ